MAEKGLLKTLFRAGHGSETGVLADNLFEWEFGVGPSFARTEPRDEPSGCRFVAGRDR